MRSSTISLPEEGGILEMLYPCLDLKNQRFEKCFFYENQNEKIFIEIR